MWVMNLLRTQQAGTYLLARLPWSCSLAGFAVQLAGGLSGFDASLSHEAHTPPGGQSSILVDWSIDRLQVAKENAFAWRKWVFPPTFIYDPCSRDRMWCGQLTVGTYVILVSFPAPLPQKMAAARERWVWHITLHFLVLLTQHTRILVGQWDCSKSIIL